MINKKPSPKGKSVRVIFELPADAASDSVNVVGDFNNWDESKDSMKFDAKSGVWTKAISVKPGNSYEFRYLVDGQDWRNDEQADGYTQNPYHGQNSVVSV